MLTTTANCASPLPTVSDTEMVGSTGDSTTATSLLESTETSDAGAAEATATVDSSGAPLEPICGNEIVETGELCDDGNNDDGDGCSADCLSVHCIVPMTHLTVQAGIDDANCATVWVLAGTYFETLTIGRDVALRPADDGEVEIDAGGFGRPVTVTAGSVVIGPLRLTGGVALEGGGIHNLGDLMLEGTEVSGNQALGSDEGAARGGGVFHGGGTLEIVGGRINGNMAVSMSESYASASGGGIFSSGGSVLLSADSEVTENQALITSQEGGGAAGGGIHLDNSSFVMSGGLIEANRAEATNDRIGFATLGASGGGLALSQSSAVFDDVAVRDNAAFIHGLADIGEARGGGLLAEWDCQITMSLTSMIGNRAEVDLTGSSVPGGNAIAQAEGGGIYGRVGTGEDAVVFELSDCALEGNRALASTIADETGYSSTDARGGAAYLSSGTGDSLISLRLNRSLVADNSAEGQQDARGGAIYAYSGTGAAQTWLLATNSTFGGNAALAVTAQGGAVFLDGGNSLAHTRARLFNVTVTENLADVGGGLYSSGGQLDVELASSIVQGNVAALDADLACLYGGSTVSMGHNIMGSTGGCSIMGEGDSIGQDAMLLPLAYNGGPTRTHALDPTSPAHDGGNPLGCTDPDGVLLTTDQRGEARPAETACDIGAFEYQP